MWLVIAGESVNVEVTASANHHASLIAIVLLLSAWRTTSRWPAVPPTDLCAVLRVIYVHFRYALT
jgi:hypothetical protein